MGFLIPLGHTGLLVEAIHALRIHEASTGLKEATHSGVLASD
jgi:hypothetical protein